jgi:hypothetical protein
MVLWVGRWSIGTPYFHRGKIWKQYHASSGVRTYSISAQAAQHQASAPTDHRGVCSLSVWQNSGDRWLPGKQDTLWDTYGMFYTISFSLTKWRKVKPSRPPNLVRLPTCNSTLIVRTLRSSLVFEKSRVQMVTEIFRAFSQPLRADLLQLTLYRSMRVPSPNLIAALLIKYFLKRPQFLTCSKKVATRQYSEPME